jgi:hypothetical protein
METPAAGDAGGNARSTAAPRQAQFGAWNFPARKMSRIAVLV